MKKLISINSLSTFLLCLIVVSSGFLMLKVSNQDSAVMDELAHIPAGYSYVKYLDYRLNPEHPPLLKALAATPLLFLGLNFPTDQKLWTSDVNNQWSAGTDFIYKDNGQKADLIIFWSRLFPIILTLIFIILVYFLSREIVGPIWALLPSFFVGLSPNFLANGHYVTTDVAASLGFLIGIWAYDKYLTNPNKKTLWIAGIVFGISQLLKFSTVILTPLFLILSLTRWWLKSNELGYNIFSKKSLKNLWEYFISFVKILAIGYILVWGVYILFTFNYPILKQNTDTVYLLNSFSGGPDLSWSKCLPNKIDLRCIADIDIWMSSKPILRGFGQYILGILMVIQRSTGGNTSYFIGNISSSGWWYYFPILFFTKEPIPILIIIALGLYLAIKRFFKNTKDKKRNRFFNYLEFNFYEFSMILTVLLYWLYSIRSNLDIGIRHILPTLPLLYILATGSIKKWFNSKLDFEYVSTINRISSAFKTFLKKSLKFFLILLISIWLIADTISAYPYFLSYYNYFGGGIWNGYKIATDSNYDWGQDLKRLKDFVDKNNIQKIGVDYFGGGNPEYYLGNKYVSWWDSKRPIEPGWYAISANSLQVSIYNTTDKTFENNYAWTLQFKPVDMIGNSIFIYNIK